MLLSAALAGLWPAPAPADQAERIGEEFTEALRDLEAEKARAEHVLGAELSAKLQASIQEWLASARAAKSAELNKPVEQRWELLPEMFGSPVRYEYYLREFAYAVDRQDVVKTQSVLAPYKAGVQILETLAVTRYYPPHTSDPTRFRFTVVTPVMVDFEYHGERFVPARTERGQPKMKRGWQ